MIAVVRMGEGFIHPLLGVLLHCQDEGARRDAAQRYYQGKHWRVRAVRPSGTRLWAKDVWGVPEGCICPVCVDCKAMAR